MENKSTARRKIAQIKQGRIISTWDGIREMCSVLHLDRRAVMRHLKKEDHYNSVKGFSEREIKNGEKLIEVFTKITQLNKNVIKQNDSVWQLHDALGKSRVTNFGNED